MMSREIRSTEPKDAAPLISWLDKGDILQWFPMCNRMEIEDSVRIWMAYAKLGASLTLDLDKEPAGMALLNLQPYQKLAHQCLLTIVMAPEHRGKGLGTELMHALMKLGKERFHLTMLHLEVYDGNPAIWLYRKLGFTEFGRQERFIKEADGSYTAKTLMQKTL